MPTLFEPSLERTVAYLGPAGTHSHLAAIGIFGPIDRHGFCYSGVVPGHQEQHLGLQKVLMEVADGRAGWGVVPYYNTSSGPVRQVYAALLDVQHGVFARLQVCGCVSAQISQDLLGSGSLTEVKHIYSKKEALDQCEKRLKILCPSAVTEPIGSTAEAARRAEKDGVEAAAVASRHLLPFHRGLRLLEPDVQDVKANITRFLVIQGVSSRRRMFSATESFGEGKQRLRQHTWIEFVSSLEEPILQKVLSSAEGWGLPAFALSGTVTRPETFEMRFLVELAAPITSLRTRFFLSDTSYLPLTIVGSPVMASLNDTAGLEEWLALLAQNVGEPLSQATIRSKLASQVQERLSQTSNYRLFAHPTVSNMESVWQLLGVPAERMVNTQVCVNPSSGQLAFCCVPGGKKLDVARVSAHLGGSFERAKTNYLKTLGQNLGALSPFTAPVGAKVLWDKSLTGKNAVFMGSGDPCVSIAWAAQEDHAPFERVVTEIAESS
jgi:prephenate dehydratase/prolyl-tRNA editing enzyme YbaK/EbsC (Cys-tRNA(Pro) deacylase)